MAWVQHMIKSINSNGRMTVVLPHGALFRKGAEGRIRKELLEQDMLEAVVGLGPNIFYGTQLAACVMVFKQYKDTDKKNKVLFIDASDQIRVGRAQNYLEPNNVNQIFNWFTAYQDVENYVKVASIADIEGNNSILNIPLYVEKIMDDKLPSVEDALLDLKTAWQESSNAEGEFKRIYAMITFEPKRWRQTYISNLNNTGWRCGFCETGVLKLMHPIKTKASHLAINIECSHPKCRMTYAAVGKTTFMARNTKVSKNYYKIDDIRLYPTHFQPALDLVCLPKNLGEDASVLIKLSFNHYWNDWDACINKIRQAVEIIIKDMKGIGSSLHAQIESLRITLGDELTNSFIALKWIGNDGSHFGGDFTKEQVLDTYSILVSVLNQLYPDHENENVRKELIESINTNKGVNSS